MRDDGDGSGEGSGSAGADSPSSLDDAGGAASRGHTGQVAGRLSADETAAGERRGVRKDHDRSATAALLPAGRLIKIRLALGISGPRLEERLLPALRDAGVYEIKRCCRVRRSSRWPGRAGSAWCWPRATCSSCWAPGCASCNS